MWEPAALMPLALGIAGVSGGVLADVRLDLVVGERHLGLVLGGGHLVDADVGGGVAVGEEHHHVGDVRGRAGEPSGDPP